MNKRILIAIIIVLVLLLVFAPRGIIMVAVDKEEIEPAKYVICRPSMTTGADWVALEDDRGEVNEMCYIRGSKPFGGLALSGDITRAENMYVFYVEEKRRVYCELADAEVLEYVVSNWDILYPIKRDLVFFEFLRSKRYITHRDIYSESWLGLKYTEYTDKLADVLEDLGWLPDKYLSSEDLDNL